MLRVFLAAMTNIVLHQNGKSQRKSACWTLGTRGILFPEHAMTDVLPGDVIGIFYNNGNENFWLSISIGEGYFEGTMMVENSSLLCKRCLASNFIFFNANEIAEFVLETDQLGHPICRHCKEFDFDYEKYLQFAREVVCEPPASTLSFTCNDDGAP